MIVLQLNEERYMRRESDVEREGIEKKKKGGEPKMPVVYIYISI